MSTRTVYIKTALVGGTTNAVDGIDGDDLLDGDVCHAYVSDVAYQYVLDDDSGAAESSPDILAPDSNPGDKRWILQNAYGLAGKAASGVNADITSMTGLDDDGIPVAKVAGAAASGVNADITSMTGLDDDGIPVAKVADAMKDDGSNLAIGSDADGDTYYRASGKLARLAKGSPNLKQFMNAAGTGPEWDHGITFVSSSRDLTAAAGDVSYSGAGFKPRATICLSCINNTGNVSIGMQVGLSDIGVVYRPGTSSWVVASRGLSNAEPTADDWQRGNIKSLDSDGITLTWTKGGSPSGTLSIYFCFLR
ncbi:MAG: hypothetical protein PHQ43_01770 [Dehalococcoidales bacterium]|nr:hypothetical protein [Dehalococcoidales bacterium]